MLTEAAVRYIKLAVDFAIAAAALLLAVALAARGAPDTWLPDGRLQWQIFWAALYALIAVGAVMAFRLERSPWRFVSARDVYSIVSAAAAAAFCFLVILFIFNRATALPRLSFLLVGLVHVMGMLSARLMLRVAHERRSLRRLLPWLPPAVPPGAPVVAVGSAAALDAALRDLELRPDPRFEVVGLLTLEARWRGQWIRDLEVIGAAENLPELWRGRPDAPQGASRGVLFVEQPRELGLKAEDMQRLRADGAVIYGMEGAADRAREEPPGGEALVRLLSGRRVMVIGAGGRLGAELCRVAAHLGCAHLSLLEVSEFALFSVHTAMQREFGEISVTDALCDVRERALVRRWIEREKPHLILHAAALRVPALAERHPGEVVRTNVVGVRNVLEAAADARVETVALMAAVDGGDPGPVLEAAGRLAELTLAGPSAVRRVAVRFDQAALDDLDAGAGRVAGLALQAVALAAEEGPGFSAFAIGDGAVVDLAQWRAGAASPGVEALARPGETLDPAGVPSIFRVRTAHARAALASEAIEEMERLAKRNDGSSVRGLMLDLSAGR